MKIQSENLTYNTQQHLLSVGKIIEKEMFREYLNSKNLANLQGNLSPTSKDKEYLNPNGVLNNGELEHQLYELSPRSSHINLENISPTPENLHLLDTFFRNLGKWERTLDYVVGNTQMPCQIPTCAVKYSCTLTLPEPLEYQYLPTQEDMDFLCVPLFISQVSFSFFLYFQSSRIIPGLIKDTCSVVIKTTQTINYDQVSISCPID